MRLRIIQLLVKVFITINYDVRVFKYFVAWSSILPKFNSHNVAIEFLDFIFHKYNKYHFHIKFKNIDIQKMRKG